jgi:signal transduction histidine kinase
MSSKKIPAAECGSSRKNGVSFTNAGDDRDVNVKTFPMEKSTITAFHEDRERHLWFGTWFGLIEWSDSVIARYDTRDGLSGDIVQAIAEDRSGNLWIGTRGGLTKFPHTERISYIPLPPLTLERIRDDKAETIVSSTNTVSYDERIVTFRAGSVSYFDEQNMEFQFRLNGFETDWNPPTRTRTIRYTTLPSGEYTLDVRARNRNGEWTEPVQYSFVILPPFWKSGWFVGSVALLILGTAFGFVRQRFLRLRNEADSQEQFSKQLMDVYETERKRIASELHDGLGQNLLIIANRAKMGLKKDGTEAMQKEFEIISSSALESIGDVRKITYNLHPLQIEEVGLTAALESMLKRISQVGDRTLSYIVEQIDDLLPKDYRIHFYRLVQEVLNNAVKHSEASAVEVTVVMDEDSIRAIVKDNGKGFDPKEKKEGYGMRSLNERVKILGGTYQIESAPGAGTIIKINIPIRTILL